MDNQVFSKKLITKVGGKSNIDKVIHCVTRLRFYLIDPSKADTNAIKKMDGVMSVIQAQGQYQVVVGNKVNEMYESLMSELEPTKSELKNQNTSQTLKNQPLSTKIKNGFNELIGVITGSMIPIIGILAGSGILKGLLAASVSFGVLSGDSQGYILVNTIADGIFYFLPVILGFTSAQKLGSNPIVIAVIGGILIHPTIVGIASGEMPTMTIAGIAFPIMNYISSVFPILVAAWLGKHLEILLKRTIPTVIQSIILPIIEIVILSVVILLFVGPAITLLSDALANGIAAIFDFNAIIGGAIYAALFPILVVFGMHWPLIPIIVNDLTVNGFSMMNAFSSVLMMGIAGAALAVSLKTKKEKLRQLGIAATISQLCGVGEPAIYGILLKYKRVFYLVTLANFIGGALAGALQPVNYGFAGALIGFASFINPDTGIDGNFYNYLITHLGTFFLSFILTWLIGYNDQMKATDEI